MEISFVRTHGSPDRVYVRRTDGTEVSWSFPTFGSYVPHDLVHLVVETAFGLKNGFWGNVDSGIDVARINADANRNGGANKYAAFGSDRFELYLAEQLAATRWGDSTLSDAEIAGDLGRACPGFPAITPDKVSRIRTTLDRLCGIWITLLPKGTLRASFNSKNPQQSFEELSAEPERHK